MRSDRAVVAVVLDAWNAISNLEGWSFLAKPHLRGLQWCLVVIDGLAIEYRPGISTYSAHTLSRKSHISADVWQSLTFGGCFMQRLLDNRNQRIVIKIGLP